MRVADTIEHLPAPLQGAIVGVIGLAVAVATTVAIFHGLEVGLGGRAAFGVGLVAGVAALCILATVLGHRFATPVGGLLIVVGASAVASLAAALSPILWTWSPLVAPVLAAGAAGSALLRPLRPDPPEQDLSSK